MIFTLASFVTAPAYAEHSVGFAAGSTRGLGATYRYLPDAGDQSSWGWQVTGLPIITQDSGTISGGGALLYLLQNIHKENFLWFYYGCLFFINQDPE